jgi:hypothetical protein
MRGMLEDVGHRLKGGAVVRSFTVRGRGLREGDIAKDLAALETASDGKVTFGSYPWFAPPDSFGVHLVARSADPEALGQAGEDLKELARARGVEPEVVDEPAA